MPIGSVKKATKKPEARSRITNGKSLGVGDGRTVWARRLRDVIELYSGDVSSDPSAIPEATKSLIRRAATLTVELERAEAGFAEKGEADAQALGNYQTAANSLRRLLESLRIKVSIKDAAEVAKTIEGEKIVKRYVQAFTPDDRAVCYGRQASTRDIARAIMFMVEKSLRTGEPLPEPLAKFAVENGLAQYAGDGADTEDANVL